MQTRNKILIGSIKMLSGIPSITYSKTKKEKYTFLYLIKNYDQRKTKKITKKAIQAAHKWLIDSIKILTDNILAEENCVDIYFNKNP